MVKRKRTKKLQAKDAYCTEKILKTKNDYILGMASKLNDPKAAPKIYWSILNRFLYNKKIPSILLLFVNSKFISDFRVKANVFNGLFASISTSINNGSALQQFAYRTDVKISFFRVNQDVISLIIKTLDEKKAHDWDKILIRTIQICGDSIPLPFTLILEPALKEKKSPDIWEKANVVPVHKKEQKNLLKNYHPIILLPIFTNIFERIIYNSLLLTKILHLCNPVFFQVIRVKLSF